MFLFSLSSLLRSLTKWRQRHATTEHAEKIAQLDRLSKPIETLEKKTTKCRQRHRRIKALKKKVKRERRRRRLLEILLKNQSRDVSRLQRRLRMANTTITRLENVGARNAGPQIRSRSPDVFSDDSRGPRELGWPYFQPMNDGATGMMTVANNFPSGTLHSLPM
ncbi:hypothetical protein LY76DRAFT_372887 [Colletotrichum caudatum]|nr:hypothetical protein LY76DRAFT_372887 [Colletotrichum caudatum]